MKFTLVTFALVVSLFGIDNGIYNVVKVIDGDTIDVVSNDNPEIKTRVRMAFIDTMESMKNVRAKNYLQM